MSNDKTFGEITGEDAAEYAAWCIGSLYGDEHPAVEDVTRRCLEDDLFFEFYRREYADHHRIPRGPSPGFTVGDLVCTSSRHRGPVTELSLDDPNVSDAALGEALRRTLNRAESIDRALSERALLSRAEGLAEVLRLEISGERDGNGCWSGSDPVEWHIEAMEDALQRYRQRVATIRQLVPPVQDDSVLPF